MRQQLDEWMIATEDPALAAFRHRNDREVLDSFLEQSDREIRIGVPERLKNKLKDEDES